MPEMSQHRLAIHQRAAIGPDVGPITAVWISLGAFDHLSPDRIQVDVPNQLCQVLIGLAQDRLVTALKEVADLLVFPIMKLAVAGKDPLHDAADGVVLHLDKEMKVVRHEAAGVEVEGEFGFLMFENLSKSEVVGAGAGDYSAIVPARDDVIENAA
jgi:hypothetical protein